MPLAERLWAKVRKGSKAECWPFVGSTNESGYGSIWDGARLMKAHRAAFIVTHGPVPDGHFVCHRCDNPSCCNPSHLFAGTRSDNMIDCANKGRLNSQHRVRRYRVNKTRIEQVMERSE